LCCRYYHLDPLNISIRTGREAKWLSPVREKRTMREPILGTGESQHGWASMDF
jgi:hypothetical protein